MTSKSKHTKVSTEDFEAGIGGTDGISPFSIDNIIKDANEANMSGWEYEYTKIMENKEWKCNISYINGMYITLCADILLSIIIIVSVIIFEIMYQTEINDEERNVTKFVFYSALGLEFLYLICSIIMIFGVKYYKYKYYRLNRYIKIFSIFYALCIIIVIMFDIKQNYLLWYIWYTIFWYLISIVLRGYIIKQYEVVYGVICQLNKKYEIDGQNKSIANSDHNALDVTWNRPEDS